MSLHPVQTILHQAYFTLSAQRFDQCPADEGVEVAFAGRSNAGKSSAINRLTGQKSLARTSKTPGRTQLINFFALSEQARLVDLPGYGYAKVAKSTRNDWQDNIDQYLSERKSLAGLILLMDIRHPLKEYDQLLIDWAAESGLPLHILLTKADKLKFGAAKNALQKVTNTLKEHPAPLTAQLFSSTNGQGCEQAWNTLGKWLALQEPSE